MNEQSNGRRQNGELDIDFVPELEQEIDRWIDIAYDENGDEIANDDAELLQAQEASAWNSHPHLMFDQTKTFIAGY